MRKRVLTVTAAAAVLAAAGGTGIGVAVAGSHGYSARLVRQCNHQIFQANVWHDMALAATPGEPALRDLRHGAALLRQMKREGCPNGPYPLKIPR